MCVNLTVLQKMKTLALISMFLGGLAFAGMEELRELVPEERSWFTTVAAIPEAGGPSPEGFEAIVVKSFTGIDTISSHTIFYLAIEITDSSLPEWEIGHKRVLIVDRLYGGANPMRDEPFREGETIRMLVFGVADGEVFGYFEPKAEISCNNAQQAATGNAR